MKSWANWTILRISCALMLLSGVMALPLPSAWAQEAVIFPSAPTPISPFKIRKAKAKGIILTPEPGIDLTGHLFRPKTEEPRPAVIILLSGVGLQSSHLSWGKTLAEWGYVALVIDSFGSRGGTDFRDTPSVGMPADAMNGASYLSTLAYVDSKNIALLGFSMGGSRIFSILGKTGENRSKEGQFKAGIAFYPNCILDKHLQVPLLVFGGDNDEMMAFTSCKTMSANADKMQNDLTFVVYSGATHFFDNPAYRKDGKSTEASEAKTSPPLHFANNHYDPVAHEDAKRKVRDFLKKQIGGYRE